MGKEYNLMSVINITPIKMVCGLSACPAIYETDKDTYLVIGKNIQTEGIPDEVKRKIGEGETCVEVPKGLIDKLNA